MKRGIKRYFLFYVFVTFNMNSISVKTIHLYIKKQLFSVQVRHPHVGIGRET